MDYAYLYAAKRGDPSGAILHSRATMVGDVPDNNARAKRNGERNNRATKVGLIEKSRLGVP